MREEGSVYYGTLHKSKRRCARVKTAFCWTKVPSWRDESAEFEGWRCHLLGTKVPFSWDIPARSKQFERALKSLWTLAQNTLNARSIPFKPGTGPDEQAKNVRQALLFACAYNCFARAKKTHNKPFVITLIIMSAVWAVSGIYILFAPENTLAVYMIIVGILAIIDGLIRVLKAYRIRHRWYVK